MRIQDRWSPRSWTPDIDWNLSPRFWNTVKANWHQGFTAFGGPPVHFKIV